MLKRARVDGIPVDRDRRTGILLIGGAEAPTVRVPGDSGEIRAVSQVPREEIELAAQSAVRDALAIGDEQLAQLIRRVFGW